MKINHPDKAGVYASHGSVSHEKSIELTEAKNKIINYIKSK